VSGGSGRGAFAFATLGDAGQTASGSVEVGRGISDVQLVALARESRGEALEVMYGAYKTRIYTFLLRLLSDPESADDLTQDVFTKAYVALGSLTNEHRVLPWLYRIANNAAIDHIRRRRRFTWLRVGKLTLPALEPVPRVIGVLVVGPEHQIEHGLSVDPGFGTERGHVRERRRREHAVEVEQHRLDRHVSELLLVPAIQICIAGTRKTEIRCS